MKYILVVISLIIGSFIIYTIGHILYKNYVWNKGKCRKCGHNWEYGGVYIGKRVKFNYMCPHCSNYTGFIFNGNEFK